MAGDINRLALVLSAAVLVGCGGGGTEGGESNSGSFFAVEQFGSGANALTSTVVCVNGTGFIDPVSAEGRRMGSYLARHHNLTGSYQMLSRTQKSCRDQYISPTVVMTLAEYQQRVVASITAVPIVPIACPVTAGSGFEGLQLSGAPALSFASPLARDVGTALIDPGVASYSMTAAGAPATTGALRLSLWALKGSYTGAAMSGGQLVGRDLLNGVSPLRNGQTYDFPVFTLDTTGPTRGAYCMVALLEEKRPDCSTTDGYCIIDWQQFGQSWTFE